MFLLTVFPMARLPRPAQQALTYFTPQCLNKGSLVLIPLRKRKVKGVVIACQKLDKLTIKRADFKLKGINEILIPEKLFYDWQIDLAEYLAEYYWTSPGLFLKMMMIKTKSLNIKTKKSKIKQILILVPEVAQIEPTVKNLGLKDYVILHSGLKQKEYVANWLKVKNGQIKNIIGTRMAVFAPFTQLEKIIILDESNPHHKSWEMTPHYRVHEVAQKLTELHQAKLVFKSEIPSIKKPSLGSAKAVIIDMKQELKEGNFSIFSRQVQAELQKIIKSKTKAILFINRRGAGTFILCRDCGYVAICPDCDVPLVQHISKKSDTRLAISDWRLVCHHCGYKEKPPGICPVCKSIRIKAFGAGTQKVEIELKKLFPQLNLLRLDSDTAETLEKQKQIIQKFTGKKADVLITTQMLFTHNQFNNINLAALISADTLLHLPDFRSGERTFQTIAKLKKIASPKTSFLIQSYNPENYAIRYAAQNNWQKFYQEEIKARAELDYPPFSQIIKLRFTHRDAKKAEQEARILAAKLTRQIKNLPVRAGGRLAISDMQLLGPSPAFIPKLKDKYIWQILLKNKLSLLKRNKLLAVVPSNWQIDVDPETTL